MNCRTYNQMRHCLCIVNKRNATWNVQLLQQQFCDMRMKSDTIVMDHINNVEHLAMIFKIVNTLPPHFCQLQTSSLTLYFLMEGNKNYIQRFHNDKGKNHSPVAAKVPIPKILLMKQRSSVQQDHRAKKKNHGAKVWQKKTSGRRMPRP